MNLDLNYTKEINTKIKQHMDEILLLRFSDLDKDQRICEELLKLCEDVNYTYGIAYACAYLGDCFIGKNESASAYATLIRAQEICEKNRYLDLLSNVCTWLGIYYEMQSDRQMAMHYYLDALELAERNHDLLRQSILLNNIASQFQNCENYEVAKTYYIKAFDCLKELDVSDNSNPHFVQMSANVISACCHLNQIDEARKYFALIKDSKQLAENQNQIYLCELLISSTEKDIDAMHKNIDKLLDESEKYPTNTYQFFATLLVVAEMMLDLNDLDYTKRMLNTLDNLCKKDEYGQMLKVQYVWMRFYKNHGTQEEKNKAYKRFYELRQMSDDILNHNLSEGLLSKIKLRESMKINEAIEKEKEQLAEDVQMDELTQLYNRRSFREMTQSVSVNMNVETLSLIMIDVDYFKQYNDTYGHGKGDEVLREVAHCMRSIANGNVFGFRYGGDEFVSMCQNMSEEEVKNYIRDFTTLLAQKKIEHKESLCSDKVTLSIGYSYHTRKKGKTLDTIQMMSEADNALYWIKDQGRNGYCKYSKDMKNK